jgi:predicted GNAT family N-acyltransferase
MLRSGLPRESAVFDGDDVPTTLHFGAFDETGRNIACLSLMARAFEHRPAWQLRGMASAPAWRGRGVGKELWLHAEAEARRIEPAWVFWCNPREAAAGFYERLGWRVVSERFEIPGVGPHLRMVKA